MSRSKKVLCIVGVFFVIACLIFMSKHKKSIQDDVSYQTDGRNNLSIQIVNEDILSIDRVGPDLSTFLEDSMEKFIVEQGFSKNSKIVIAETSIKANNGDVDFNFSVVGSKKVFSLHFEKEGLSYKYE